MVNLFKKNKWFLIIFAVFIFTRFLGLGQIYHQDEYRWATIVNPAFEESLGSHPPMNRLVLGLAGRVFGYDNLRVAPFVFSILNLWLIYFISLKLSGNKKTAYIASGLFTVNIYSLISNLQIDIDGALLPFFVLACYYAYLNLSGREITKKWIFIFFAAVAGGLLTKLSFLLFIGALIIDQLLGAYYSEDKAGLKIILKKARPWVVGFLAVSGAFYYFYATRLGVVIEYAWHFKSLNFASRAYFDLIFKIFKSFVWLSPLLALPVIYGLFKKELLNKYRLWFLYLFLNLVFYLVLFDFSTLTVERYFMFMVVPAVLISAEAVSVLLEKQNPRKNFYIMVAAVFILISYLILSLPHDVIPLNPKEAYLDRVKSLDLKFLIPFTGGSGPSGFYFSALFIMLSWLVAIVSLALAVLKKQKSIFLTVFVIIGLGYNIFFGGEYLFGSVYGSVDKVAKETIEYVNSEDAIGKVITYYDIGAYYLRLSGKYYSRFYTAPKRDYTPKIANYRGQYLIVDFPAIDKGGRYWPLIAKCPLIKQFRDKMVESYIFDCSKI
ncbi:MAG: glycosyltransferase family 39 protein [Patescibacteria group bacterium]